MRVTIFGLALCLSGCIVPGGPIHPISELQIASIFAPERPCRYRISDMLNTPTTDAELNSVYPATKSGKDVVPTGGDSAPTAGQSGRGNLSAEDITTWHGSTGSSRKTKTSGKSGNVKIVSEPNIRR